MFGTNKSTGRSKTAGDNAWRFYNSNGELLFDVPTSAIAGEALTKVDDSNVTLTLGGTPGSALLKAVSLALGWTGLLPISRGGTGQSTANDALNALLPSQTGQSGKVLGTDGTNASWVTNGGGGGSAHTIRENGTDQTQRGALNFIDPDAGTGLITDDAANNETEVNLSLYRLESQDHNHQSSGLQGGQLDHGLALIGLSDDDHPQYVLRSILTTDGDIFIRAAGAIARLGIGTEGQVLTVSGGLPAWATPAGGGGGAPTDAEYLVAAAHASLSAERVATNTATVTWDFATAGQAKANVPDAAITNAKLANMAAWTLKGRNNAASGVPQDIALADLTEDTTPSAGDKLLGFAPTGELRKFDVGNLPAGGGGGGAAESFHPFLLIGA